MRLAKFENKTTKFPMIRVIRNFMVKIIENFPSFVFIWRGYKKWKNHEFFPTIFEECHKNEVGQISKQNMKISKG